jgi:hypothetical protein
MSWIDVNGIGIETPRREPPPDKIHEMRATVLFWNDMKQAGIPLRSIAACFGISHQVVLEHIQQIPEDIKEAYVSDDFVGRLRAAFPKGRRPKSAADLRVVLQGPGPDAVY